MATAAVGVGTPRELSSLESDGHPVLSVYLDLDTTRFPTPAARDAELSALLSHADAHNADAEQICGLLDAQPKLTRGAPGLAIFSSAQAEALEAVSLQAHVDPVIDTIPSGSSERGLRQRRGIRHRARHADDPRLPTGPDHRERAASVLAARPRRTAPARRSDGQARRGPRREKHDI